MKAEDVATIALGLITLGGAAYVIAKSERAGGGGGGGVFVSVPETPVNVEAIIRNLREGFETLAAGQISLAEFFGKQISELSKGQANLAEFFGKQISELSKGQASLAEIFGKQIGELARGQIELAKIFTQSEKEWVRALEKLSGMKFEGQKQLNELIGKLDEYLKKASQQASKPQIPQIPERDWCPLPKEAYWEIYGKPAVEKAKEGFKIGWDIGTFGFGFLPNEIFKQLYGITKTIHDYQQKAVKRYHEFMQNLRKRGHVIRGGAGRAISHTLSEYTVRTGYKLGGRPWSFHVNLASGWVAGL